MRPSCQHAPCSQSMVFLRRKQLSRRLAYQIEMPLAQQPVCHTLFSFRCARVSRMLQSVSSIDVICPHFCLPKTFFYPDHHRLTPACHGLGIVGSSPTAFISPIESVFQFLEDTVTVQINYSLAAGTTSKTKEIFWTSIRSAIICGVAASLMCTVIGKAHDSLATVVAPGAENDKNMYMRLATPACSSPTSTHTCSLIPRGPPLHFQLYRYPGCALIEDALTVARSARPFFLLYIWRFPFKFVNLVISGLLFGAKQIQLMGCIWLLGEVALLLTWYWLPTADERHDNTMLLGLSSLLQVVVVSVVAMSALFFLKPLQVYTGVNFLLADPKPTTLREQLAEKDAEPARQPLIRGLSKLQKELMLDGAKVLMMDLCLQLATTITFYVALLHSAPTAYQLTALNNAMPQYGLAYVIGIRFISKIIGAQLLSRRRYAAFRVFAAMALVATLLICCVSIGVVLSYRDSIAFEYGYVLSLGPQSPVSFSTSLAPFYSCTLEIVLSHSVRSSAFRICSRLLGLGVLGTMLASLPGRPSATQCSRAFSVGATPFSPTSGCLQACFSSTLYSMCFVA
jgi:hypothetical protein